MKIAKISLFAFLIAVFVAAVSSGSSVLAAWEGISYFENASTQTWPPSLHPNDPDDAEGQYSKRGSVMPNPYPLSEPGYGAIGRLALDAQEGSTDKEKLFNFLKKKNQDGTAWEQMGSALIVHQMLQRAWGVGEREIPTEDWTELRARLVLNDNIIMVIDSHSARDNTAGALVREGGSGPFDTYDAFRYDIGFSISAQSIILYNGSIHPDNRVYVLEMWCANPIGAFGGLPDYEPDPTEYNLQPSIENAPTTVEPGGRIVLDGLVENTGSDPSPGNEWQLTRVFYGPGANPGTSGGENSADACAFFDSGGRLTTPSPPWGVCGPVDGGTGTTVFPEGVRTPVLTGLTFDVPDIADVGTRICFALSVKPYAQDANQNFWRHSSLVCVMVSKSPKLQVWGGDVRSGGKIDTSTSIFAGESREYGSWGEYGVLSRLSNSKFGSGEGLNNGGSIGQSSWSNLTFANTGSASSCTFGCYNFSLSSGGLTSQFAAASDATELSGTRNLGGLEGVYTTDQELVISASTITSGQTVIILATDTVTIDGNITYQDGPYSSIGDIPQVIIRAPRIDIRGGVGQVDAWLLAINTGTDGISNTDDDNGTLNTCSSDGGATIEPTDNLSANMCNNRLTINGPVVADTIYLRRTAGSGSASGQRGEPAEVFNLRADAYLWARAHGSGSNRIQTVYTRELSPRF